MLHLLALVLAQALAPVGPPDPVQGQERIVSIELAGSGKAGTIVTTPVLLGGERTAYAFGHGGCKGHRLEAALVEQLLAAMRARSPVRIEALVVGRGAAEQRCIAAVTFFAPAA